MSKGWALPAWNLFPTLQQAPISEYVGIPDSRTSKNAIAGAYFFGNSNIFLLLPTILIYKVCVEFCKCVIHKLAFLNLKKK